jgi:hypothetical protein
MPAIKWIETTVEQYDRQNGVLPPAATGASEDGFYGFQVGEAMSHNSAGEPTFETYKSDGAKFFVADDAMTFAEFKAEFPNAEYYYDE